MNREHELKCTADYYEDVESGRKPFELRYNDRNFQAGDTILLRKTDRVGRDYLGEQMKLEITCVVSGKPWLADNYVCLGVKKK